MNNTKNKLWRFGDSWSLTQIEKYPNELNHNEHIANHYDLELIHMGEGGISNLEILKLMLDNDYKFEKNDMIIVNFPSLTRFSITNKFGNLISSNSIKDVTNYESMSDIKDINSILDFFINHSWVMNDTIFILFNSYIKSLKLRNIKVVCFYNVIDTEQSNDEKKFYKLENLLNFNPSYTQWIQEMNFEDLTNKGNLHYLYGVQLKLANEIIKRIDEIYS